MKKIVLALFTMLFLSASIFAQSDLQVLAVVKYNKNESITVKQLKKRVGFLEKQREAALATDEKLSVDEIKQVLNTLIEEKLVVQAAQKDGFSIPDSVVNQNFELELSRRVNARVTEKQFEEIVRNQLGMTSDEYFNQLYGLTKNEYKEYLKNQLIIQQYIMYKNQAELQKIVPTDEQIRLFYEAQKSSFIMNDTANMVIVMVPKGNDDKAAKVKANELRNKYADKKITVDQLEVQSKSDKSGYVVARGLVDISPRGVQQTGIPIVQLIKLFSNDEGYVSEVFGSDAGYTFVGIIKKYSAKMLGLSDLIQPETTFTVYEYIKSVLTQQLQGQFLQQKLIELADSLNTSANVEMKKTGAALEKLLDWGD